jgi:hypothetical protein
VIPAIVLAALLGGASWDDQCTVAVYDYALQECYVEDVEPSEAACSEFRVYTLCGGSDGSSSFELGCVPASYLASH